MLSKEPFNKHKVSDFSKAYMRHAQSTQRSTRELLLMFHRGGVTGDL